MKGTSQFPKNPEPLSSRTPLQLGWVPICSTNPESSNLDENLVGAYSRDADSTPDYTLLAEPRVRSCSTADEGQLNMAAYLATMEASYPIK